MPYDLVQFSGVALSSPRGSLHFDIQIRSNLHKVLRFSFLKEAIWGVLPPALSLENHSWGFLREIFLASSSICSWNYCNRLVSLGAR